MPLAFLFWGSLLTFLFVVASYIYLIIKFAPQTDWSALHNLDFKFLLLAVFLLFTYHLLDTLRLKTIAEGFNIRYGYLYGYITSLIATFGATITPAHIGGELVIYYLLRRLGIQNRKIWGTILFKTISGVSFFFVALPIFIIYTVSNEWILKKLLLLGVIFALFSLISFPIFKWFQKLEKGKGISKGIKRYCMTIFYFWRKKRILFLKACLYSIGLYLVFLSFAPVILKAFHLKFNLLEVYFIQLPLIYAIFTSPSPGGSGVGELGGVAIFEGIVPPNVIGIFIILWRFLSQYLSATVGGLIFTILVYRDWRNFELNNPLQRK